MNIMTVSTNRASIRLLATTALVCLGLSSASTALAQDAPTSDPGADQGSAEGDTETIIVTAQQARKQVVSDGSIGVLGDMDALSTPFNVSSYTAQLILDQQSETIGDVLENEPSVRTTQAFGNQAELFVIRGFALFGDDVSINGLYGITPRQLISPELYDRVQVLNGASAFLYGAAPGGSGIGGAIDLVPKTATNTLFRVTGSYNADSIFGGNFDAGTRFGRDEALGARVVGVYRVGDTSVDNEHREVTVGGLSLDYTDGPGRVMIHLGYEDQRASWSRPTVTLGAGVAVPEPPESTTNYGQPWTFTNLRDLYGVFRAELDLSEEVMTYVAFGFRDGREDGDYSTLTLTNATTGQANGGRLFVPRTDNNYAGQLGFRANFDTGQVSHRLNGGASVIFAENRNSFVFGSFPASVRTCGVTSLRYCNNIYNPVVVAPPADFFFASAGSQTNLPRVSTSNLRSYYISDTIGFLDDRLMFTGGLRYQNMIIDSYNRATLLRTSRYDESAVTPVVGIVVKPTENFSIYANRIEGLAQGPTAPVTVTNMGEVFPPFRSVQYEAGAKIELRGLTGTLAVFQTKQPNSFIDATNTFVVDGEQRNRGIELSLNGELTRRLRFIGGATLIDAKIASGATNVGNEAVGVPDYQVNLGVEYVPSFVPNLTMTGRVVMTGKQWVDPQNTRELSSWTRLDLGLRYVAVIDEHPVTFRVAAENIMDNDYWYSAFNGYLLLGAPRTLRASVTFEY